MKKSKFSEHQIVNILKEYESGKATKDICREHGISAATFYQWKQKYGGMDAQHLKELKALQEENARLKRMFADLSLDHRILKDIIEKKL
ncbi:transposase [Sphingobacterium siyangense]|uniref:Transposase n=1 Tax=Sphingobacterium siyangense TaxID=459529 RepID=A0A420FH55_9SPHI|nr:transposase [Sphingobacterium siyangense]RKF32297.1 transposase [Sphingobacterium siyangense]